MAAKENEVTVTPEIAQEWLNKSKGNRAIRKKHVARLKADLEQGRFMYNGDCIRFLQDGTLFDGHHRLTACVESGVPFKTDTFVIDESAKSTTDQGAARTTSDNFVMDLGIPHKQAAAIAAAVRLMTCHDNTVISDWGRPQSPNYSVGAKHFTYQALEAYMWKHIEELTSASQWSITHVQKSNTLISCAQSTAFICLASRVYGNDAAIGWMEQVILGYAVNPGTTAEHIRNGLMAVKMGQRKMKGHHKLYSVIKGFKSVMAGRSIRHSSNALFRPGVDNTPRLEIVK